MHKAAWKSAYAHKNKCESLLGSIQKFGKENTSDSKVAHFRTFRGIPGSVCPTVSPLDTSVDTENE